MRSGLRYHVWSVTEREGRVVSCVALKKNEAQTHRSYFLLSEKGLPSKDFTTHAGGIASTVWKQREKCVPEVLSCSPYLHLIKIVI